MPGSRHTLDRGQHLGPSRIAERIAGVGIPFADPAAARTFYVDKLSFRRNARPFQPGYPALAVPGTPDQQIDILPPPPGETGKNLPFDLIFSVPNVRHTADQLRALGVAATRHGRTLIIHDPDGDTIVLIEVHERE